MHKVKIQTPCTHCLGEAYIFQGVDENATGDPYDRYRPCPVCKGKGKHTRWISLRKLGILMEETLAFTPRGEFTDQEPVTAYQDSREAAELP